MSESDTKWCIKKKLVQKLYFFMSKTPFQRYKLVISVPRSDAPFVFFQFKPIFECAIKIP